MSKELATKLARAARHVQDTACPGCGVAAPPAIVMRCVDCGRIWPMPDHETEAPPAPHGDAEGVPQRPDFVTKSEADHA